MERTTEEAAAELSRELMVRKRCYRRWIEDGKLSAVDAKDRIERLEKALSVVEKVHILEQVPIVQKSAEKELDTAQHS